ncbi:hypothetical protein VM98_36190, partial [Streptomyces rubellomurinus subsp. indigoferus]
VVRTLLLPTPRASAPPRAPDVPAELSSPGADVPRAAWYLCDQAALADRLARFPAWEPLPAVVRLPGVLDAGAAESLAPDQLGRVFQPKVDAARDLHELTKDLGLSAFVLYSSV